MKASIIIAAHNEGNSLWRTIAACVETCRGLDHEILVANDASFDGSVEEVQRRFPQVRVVGHQERQGASPTKALGGREARGDVLVFLDGHCNPEQGAIFRLVQDVDEAKGKAIVTPTIAALNVEQWKNKSCQVGHGYFLDLAKLDCGWLPLSELRAVDVGRRRLYESPALIGCALAIHRELYQELWGFDPHMCLWGVEDLDFGLKCWLMGYTILHDPEAIIGHRFRVAFDNYSIGVENVIANQLRLARKNFTRGVWADWVDRCRQRHLGRLVDHPEGLWTRIWNIFEENRLSADQERAYLQARRGRDEFWYAERFGLTWPRLHSTSLSGGTGLQRPTALAAALVPSPSPPPCPSVTIEIEDPTLPPGSFRIINFSVFKTLAPQIRITLNPPSNPQPGQFQVLVDDGEDASDDQLDITNFFSFSGGVAVANLPETVPLDSLPGPNQSTFRALFTDPTQVRIIYYGENRLRLLLFGQSCFSGNFLSYDDADRIVVGMNDGTEPIPGEPANQMMTNHIILNFDPATTDAAISAFLFGQSLRPQGIDRDLGVVQIRDLRSLSGSDLLNRIAELGADMGNPDSAHIDRLTGDPAMCGDNYPPAISLDFRAATADWSANGRSNHYQHFTMQTFPAHRLIAITKSDSATVRVFMAGSGVATGNNFSGAAANNPNTYFVRGNRMVQATDVTERAGDGGAGRVAVTNPGDNGNPNAGDIRNVADLVAGNGHDTGVMSTLAGDGVGDLIGGMDRNVNQIELGTGKDSQIQVRIVRFPLSVIAYYKQLDLSAADGSSRIHLIERSYSTANPAPNAAVPNLNRRYTAIANAGKLIIGAAWNENANVATSDSGRIGPSHNNPRPIDPTAANFFTRNVMVVGYSTRVLLPNTLEVKGALSNVGAEISVVGPSENIFRVLRNGTLGVTAGTTSFAVPLVGGIAAEMMLVDTTLQQAANIVKVAEFIEATSDDIDAAGVDNNTGHGRVNYWKAILGTANGGLSAEGRTALTNGNDNFFRSLPLKNEDATTWYGFDVRTNIQNAVLWFRNNIGQYSKVSDANQARPTIAGAFESDVLTYMSTQPLRNAGGRLLPALPFSAAELTAATVTQRFLARFSIKRDQISDKADLLALPLGKSPVNDPETVIFDLPINDRTDLRRAQGATGADAALIKALVTEFNNFVFHIDCNPVAQVRARLPNQNFTVGQTIQVNLELRNIGASNIPAGKWLITGGEVTLLLPVRTAAFGPLAAGATVNVQVAMTCQLAGNVTLHVTILRATNAVDRWVVATPVGPGANDSQDGTMTCT